MLTRAFVAQQFLDRRGDEREISPEFLQLIALAQQAQQSIADQVGGRLLTTHHRDNGVGNHFLLVESGC